MRVSEPLRRSSGHAQDRAGWVNWIDFPIPYPFPLLARSTISQVSLECHNSKGTLELIGLLKGKDVMVGAIDVATEKIEKPKEVARTIRAAMKFVALDKLYPCTNCGMVPLPREVALGKLKALAAGAAIVGAELTAAQKKKRS